MPTSPASKAVIITGASSGIGSAIARKLGGAGYDLWLAGRSDDGLRTTASAIAAAGGAQQVHCEALDLSKPGVLADLVKRVGVIHPHLFALINNAGIMHPEWILSGSPERWRMMFDLNVLAPLEGCRAAIETMRRHGSPGHLINISSVAAQWETGGVYAASKRALEIISSSLRLELEKDDIRITTLVPGGFVTQLGRYLEPETMLRVAASMQAKGIELAPTPDQRALGDPEHIARAVLYVLEQPTSINIERIVIRPPVDIAF